MGELGAHPDQYVAPANACEWCRRRGKTWHGGDPQCAFLGGQPFSAGNWNCATVGGLRHLLYDHYGSAPPQIRGIMLAYEDDEHFAAVMFNWSMLYVEWYKNRGCTESMWLVTRDEAKRPTESDVRAIIAHYGITYEMAHVDG